MEDCSLTYTATPVTKTKIAWTTLTEETVYTSSTVNPIVGDVTIAGDEITEIEYDMVGVPSAIIVNSATYNRNISGDLEE